MGLPAPKMMRVPTIEEYIKSGAGRTAESPSSNGYTIDRDTAERITQAGFIYDPVFTPLHSLMNE